MPTKKTAPMTKLRNELKAAKAEIEALQKDLKDAEEVAQSQSKRLDSLDTILVTRNKKIKQLDDLLDKAVKDAQFSPTPDIITNEPERVLRLAYSSKHNSYGVIADRTDERVVLEEYELICLYNLLHRGGHE
jgi:chromosome segregation ATPase